MCVFRQPRIKCMLQEKYIKDNITFLFHIVYLNIATQTICHALKHIQLYCFKIMIMNYENMKL